jgi:hypothetical protein
MSVASLLIYLDEMLGMAIRHKMAFASEIDLIYAIRASIRA